MDDQVNFKIQSPHRKFISTLHCFTVSSNSFASFPLLWEALAQVPFLAEGLRKALHVVANPFPEVTVGCMVKLHFFYYQQQPKVWHTMDDDRRHLDWKAIKRTAVILRVFVAEFLHVSFWFMGESYQYKSPSTILPINPLEGPISIDNEETYISIDVLNTVSSRRNAMSSV